MIKFIGNTLGNNFITKILTFLLLFSVFVQPFFAGSMEKPKVLCIGNNGHIAIENIDEFCVYDHHLNHNKADVQLKFEDNLTAINNLGCFDIFISTIDIFENKIHSLNFNLQVYYLNTNYSFPKIKDLTRISKISYISNQREHKILNEISKISLLL